MGSPSCSFCGMDTARSTAYPQAPSPGLDGLSDLDREAIARIALLHGVDKSNVRQIDAPLGQLLDQMGPASARLSEHRFPVYCWEHRRASHQACVVRHLVIDQGQRRFVIDLLIAQQLALP